MTVRIVVSLTIKDELFLEQIADKSCNKDKEGLIGDWCYSALEQFGTIDAIDAEITNPPVAVPAS